MGVKGLMRTCSLRVGTKITRQMFTATLNFRAEEGLGVKEITPVGGGEGGERSQDRQEEGKGWDDAPPLSVHS